MISAPGRTIIERYGQAAIPADSSLVDWPLSYADLEPYYDPASLACRCGAIQHDGGERRR
jgi:gluconate 2-dehydrogenase alpha chain